MYCASPSRVLVASIRPCHFEIDLNYWLREHPLGGLSWMDQQTSLKQNRLGADSKLITSIRGHPFGVQAFQTVQTIPVAGAISPPRGP